MIRARRCCIAVAAQLGWPPQRAGRRARQPREPIDSWRDFLVGLKERGLHGVEFVVTDGTMPGSRRRCARCWRRRAYQRCYVHFLRNALDYVPRKVDDDCLQELRWLYDRRDLGEARRTFAAWLARWQGKDPKLTGWVEENIEETLTFYRLPSSTSQASEVHEHAGAAERGDQAAHPRCAVESGALNSPNAESCLRLVRALAVETQENWLEQHRYLNMEDLREHKKEQLRLAA